MRPLIRTMLLLLVVGVPAHAAAQNGPTLTIRDLLALSQAGLGDDVLVAMIDADRSVFTLTPLEVIDLRKQGLSDAVLVAMIRTTPPPTRDPAPTERVRADPPIVVQQTVVQDVKVETPRYVTVPVYVPVAVRPREPEKPKEPVYWGWGGQRRPDSWQETKPAETVKKPGGR